MSDNNSNAQWWWERSPVIAFPDTTQSLSSGGSFSTSLPSARSTSKSASIIYSPIVESPIDHIPSSRMTLLPSLSCRKSSSNNSSISESRPFKRFSSNRSNNNNDINEFYLSSIGNISSPFKSDGKSSSRNSSISSTSKRVSSSGSNSSNGNNRKRYNKRSSSRISSISNESNGGRNRKRGKGKTRGRGRGRPRGRGRKDIRGGRRQILVYWNTPATDRKHKRYSQLFLNPSGNYNRIPNKACRSVMSYCTKKFPSKKNYDIEMNWKKI